MSMVDLLRQSALPLIEAEVLLAALLGRERSWIVAHGNELLPRDLELQWQTWITRRRRGEPVAYIIGQKEFFGRTFLVTPAVLIPRPATERLVERAIAFLDCPQTECVEADQGIVIVTKNLRPSLAPSHGVSAAQTVVDVGTGSGCIAITLALERPGIAVIATDVSSAALAVARENAERHRVADRVRYLEGDVLGPVRDSREPFLIVSNPPYIPEGRVLSHEVVDFEPSGALFGGADGLSIIRSLLRQAEQHPFCCGMIIECERQQADALLFDCKN